MSNFNKEAWEEEKRIQAELSAAYAANKRNITTEEQYRNNMSYNTNDREPNYALWGTVWTFIGLFIMAGLITLVMVGCPTYNVYSAGMAGKAALAHANFSKEVAVAEAKARKESAEYDKAATITKAEAVARANAIIGDSLKNNEDYLKYLWITETLGSNADKQVIYVATEANVPIMEAGRVIPKQ